MGKHIPMASTSLIPLPNDIRNGMIAMGIVGLTSTISTLSLIIFITYRMIYWKSYFAQPISRNQAFILLYNLLLADLQQALSFVLSFWWIAENKLVGPNSVCFAQGWLIQVGDVSSGLWVLSIAIHTFISLVAQKQIAHKIFVTAVCSLWVFVIVLASVGPARDPDDFFVPAGSWCWMGESHSAERLYLHYVWIFISQLGSLSLYTFMFFYLKARISSTSITNTDPSGSFTGDNHFHSHGGVTTTTISVSRSDPFAISRARILRTARYMVVYPFAYVALTLPLALARVSVMAGGNPPATLLPAAGTMMASCGFVDVLLYIYTRNAVFKNNFKKKGSGMGTEAKSAVHLTRLPTANGQAIRMSGMGMGGEARDSAVSMKGGQILVTKNVVMEDESHSPSPSRSERSDSITSLVGKNRSGSRVSWAV